MEGKLQGIGHHFILLRIQKPTPIQYSPPCSISLCSSKQEARERKRNKKGRKSKHAAARLSMCSLSMLFSSSSFSLVNWILSGAVGRDPVQVRFHYTNQPTAISVSEKMW
jgi:hypothetical protein